MMALAPFAEKRLLPVPAGDKPIVPIGVILHVAESTAYSLYNYFKDQSGGIESHFYIRFDGSMEQYRDTEIDADANYKANAFTRNGVRYGFISVETQGLGSGQWTTDQIKAIKKLLEWAHNTHKIPLRVCPGPYDAGVGYHVLFGAPGPWTPYTKTCPGPNRIKQFYNEIVPWMRGEEMAAIGRYTEVDSGDKNLTADFQKKVDQGVFSKEAKPGQIVVMDRLAAFMNRQESKVIKQLIATAVASTATSVAIEKADILKIIREIGKILAGV